MGNFELLRAFQDILQDYEECRHDRDRLNYLIDIVGTSNKAEVRLSLSPGIVKNRKGVRQAIDFDRPTAYGEIHGD